ncbi:sulfotransferase [Nocardioides allogilvus]|uniref:sulfotransferase n=1 Tax=Nocardioides allogilvus TaxID=2072017 RepID=UPI0013008902|nr:sulfotransferase [Nocardioides allogilvus]
MYLPSTLRRRLEARDARARADGVREGLELARARRARERHSYVFVVTFGRSGSTLVQGLLNTLPRTLVRGENDLYLLHFYRGLAALRAFREEHKAHGSYDDASAFYGLKQIRRSAFMQAMNDVVTTGVLGGVEADDYDVVGFKEVTWHRIAPEETEDFFAVMDKAFPGVRYVLNTRDPDRALASGFWRQEDEAAARQKIARTLDIQQHLRATRPDRVLDVSYEQLTGDDDGVRDALLASLGAFVTGRPVDESLMADLHHTLARGFGPNPFGGTS